MFWRIFVREFHGFSSFLQFLTEFYFVCIKIISVSLDSILDQQPLVFTLIRFKSILNMLSIVAPQNVRQTVSFSEILKHIMSAFAIGDLISGKAGKTGEV